MLVIVTGPARNHAARHASGFDREVTSNARAIVAETAETARNPRGGLADDGSVAPEPGVFA